MRSILAEFLRFQDNSTGLLRTGDRYLVAQGERPVREVPIPIDHLEFLGLLDKLRYGKVADRERQQALARLAQIVTELLGPALGELGGGPEGDLVQYDLVANPVELSALPFELAEGSDGKPVFARADVPVVLTRRVRLGLEDRTMPWWVRPRVLFAWASPAGAGEPVPAGRHEEALREALSPWIAPLAGFEGAAPDPRGVLTRLPDASVTSIAAACLAASTEGRPYTHLHLLAHGCPIGGGWDAKFGVALHGEGGAVDPVAAEGLVGALATAVGLSVVTLAVCDSANQANTIAAGANLAHALHSKGIPVVVGSQFPLTFDGSVALARTFYGALLSGTDVRLALHQARVALHGGERDHDWASVVGYVRLPEDYGARLADVVLESEMAALRTVQAWADHLVAVGVDQPEPYDRVARQLRERIANLRRLVERPGLRPGAVVENYGLLGSAEKRLAELCFERGRQCGDADRAGRESVDALTRARAYYEQATRTDRSSHWTTAQSLALEAVLTGSIARPGRWHVAHEGALDEPGGPWRHGSLAELYLLAPVAGVGTMLDEAVRELEGLAVAVEGRDRFPAESTARQLRRYVNWWTKGNGYFGDRPADLSDEAGRLLAVIEGSRP